MAYFMLSWRDISERKEAEKNLKQSEENFRLLVRNTFDGILISDSTGRYLYANKKAAEISGYSRDELVRLSTRELTPTRLHDEVEKRIQSQFDQGAKSPAGAVGLMQLMPRTAHMLAKQLGLAKNSYISNANSNVAKGVEYIDQLYKRYDSYILTIAAYNAGPSNVNRWIKTYGDPRKFKKRDEIIKWIESVPFEETRFYIKKVLENYVVYSSMLDKSHTSKSLLEFLAN